MLRFSAGDANDMGNLFEGVRKQALEKIEFIIDCDMDSPPEDVRDYLFGEVYNKHEQIVAMQSNLTMLLSYTDGLIEATQINENFKEKSLEKDSIIQQLSLEHTQLNTKISKLEDELESRQLIIEKLEVQAETADEYFTKSTHLQDKIDRMQDKFESAHARLEGNALNVQKEKKLLQEEMSTKLQELEEQLNTKKIQTEHLRQLVEKMGTEEKTTNKQMIHLKEETGRLIEERENYKDRNSVLQSRIELLQKELAEVANVINPIMRKESTASERMQTMEINNLDKMIIPNYTENISQSPSPNKPPTKFKDKDSDSEEEDYIGGQGLMGGLVEEEGKGLEDLYGEPFRKESEFAEEPQGLFFGNFQQSPTVDINIPKGFDQGSQTIISYLEDIDYMEVTSHEPISHLFKKESRNYETEIQHEFISESKTCQISPEMSSKGIQAKAMVTEKGSGDNNPIGKLEISIPHKGISIWRKKVRVSIFTEVENNYFSKSEYSETERINREEVGISCKPRGCDAETLAVPIYINKSTETGIQYQDFGAQIHPSQRSTTCGPEIPIPIPKLDMNLDMVSYVFKRAEVEVCEVGVQCAPTQHNSETQVEEAEPEPVIDLTLINNTRINQETQTLVEGEWTEEGTQTLIYTTNNQMQTQGTDLVDSHTQFELYIIDSQVQTENVILCEFGVQSSIQCEMVGVQTLNMEVIDQEIQSTVQVEAQYTQCLLLQDPLPPPIKEFFDKQMQTIQEKPAPLTLSLTEEQLAKIPGGQNTFSNSSFDPLATPMSTASYSFVDEVGADGKVIGRKKVKRIKHDPMKDFFKLTTQSLMMNSPYIAQLTDVNFEDLYKEALRLGLQFPQWHAWINGKLHAVVTLQSIKNPLKKRLSIAKPKESPKVIQKSQTVEVPKPKKHSIFGTWKKVTKENIKEKK